VLITATACVAFAPVLQPLHARFDDDRVPSRRFRLSDFRTTIASVLKAPNLRRLSFACFAFNGVQSVFTAYFVTYLVALGYELAATGFLFSVVVAVAMPCRVLWGWVGSFHVGPCVVMAGLALGMAASVAVTGLFTAAWPMLAIGPVGAPLSATAFSWHGILLSETARLAPFGSVGAVTVSVLSFGQIGAFLAPSAFAFLLRLTGGYGGGWVLCEILRPILRVNDVPFEVLHSAPFWRVALGMTVVSLTHPQKIPSETHRFASISPYTFERPELLAARPAGHRDRVPIADVTVDTVLSDDFAHVIEDLGPSRDRRARPRLEAIAKSVKVAVGPGAGVTMGEPGAAEAFLCFDNDKARAEALFGEMIGPADPGDAGADDHDVEVLDLLGCGVGEYCRLTHRVQSRFVSELRILDQEARSIGFLAGCGRGLIYLPEYSPRTAERRRWGLTRYATTPRKGTRGPRQEGGKEPV